jgi:hypothetical protein
MSPDSFLRILRAEASPFSHPEVKRECSVPHHDTAHGWERLANRDGIRCVHCRREIWGGPVVETEMKAP